METNQLNENNKVLNMTDMNVIHCWMLINVCFMLSGLTISNAIANPTTRIVFQIVYYIGAITPFVYRIFYSKLGVLRMKSKTSSPIVVLINFVLMYALSFNVGLGNVVYAYAIIMLIVISLYQDRTNVYILGTLIYGIFLLYFFTHNTKELMSSNLFAMIILAVAIVVALIVTNGLKRYNELTTSSITDSYTESMKRNDELVAVKNRVKEDVISIGDKIKTNRMQTGNMSKSIQEVAEAIESFATSLQDINQGTVSIQSELETLSNLANIMSDLSKDTNSYLLSSDDMLTVTHEKSVEVNKISTNVNTSMEQLTASVADIGTMVNMIKGVAKQTSLLSLNASIEAARAGEAGRGFSVVAEEIRKLSDSTNESVSQIEAMMQSINSSVASTTENMDQMKGEIVSQETCVMNAQEALTKSKSAIQDLLTSIQGVTDGVVKVASVTKDVVDSTSSISALSEEISANTESISSLSVDIAKEINNIDEINTELVNDF